MRTFGDIESPSRRRLHLVIGAIVLAALYAIVVAVLRVFLF